MKWLCRKFAPDEEEARGPLSCGCRRAWYREELGELPEVLGGGGEEEFVVCAAWAAQSEPAEAEDALEVSEQHLDLFPEFAGDGVVLGFGDVARHLAGAFVL
jgi:hypothetical protein